MRIQKPPASRPVKEPAGKVIFCPFESQSLYRVTPFRRAFFRFQKLLMVLVAS